MFVEFMSTSPSWEAKLTALEKVRALNAAAYCKEIPLYSQAVADCDHSQFTVRTQHDGDHQVPVLVHTPKARQTKINDRPKQRRLKGIVSRKFDMLLLVQLDR
jgi:predicted metal-dependent TIM-barrel fold hydrolase